jgi:hypothetical protein
MTNSRRFTADASRASNRKDSTPQTRQKTAALRDFGPTYVAEVKLGHWAMSAQ